MYFGPLHYQNGLFLCLIETGNHQYDLVLNRMFHDPQVYKHEPVLNTHNQPYKFDLTTNRL